MTCANYFVVLDGQTILELNDLQTIQKTTSGSFALLALHVFLQLYFLHGELLWESSVNSLAFVSVLCKLS